MLLGSPVVGRLAGLQRRGVQCSSSSGDGSCTRLPWPPGRELLRAARHRRSVAAAAAQDAADGAEPPGSRNQDVPASGTKTVSLLGSLLGEGAKPPGKPDSEMVRWWDIKPRQSAPPRQTAMGPGRQGRFIMNEDYLGDLRTSAAAEVGGEVRLPRSVPVASWIMLALSVVVYGTYSNVLAYQGAEAGHDFLAAILLDHAQVVQQGQAWRMGPALLVHSSALQLLASIWGLATVAPEAEALLGNGPYLAIFLLSGLSGEVAALALDPAGASCGPAACLAGLAAALAVHHGSSVTAAKQVAAAMQVEPRAAQPGASSSAPAPAGPGQQAEGAGAAAAAGEDGRRGRAVLALHAAGSLGLALVASQLELDPGLQPALHQVSLLSLAVGAGAGAVLGATMGPLYQVSREPDIPVGSMTIPQDVREVVIIVDTRSDVQRGLVACLFAALLWGAASALLPGM